MTINSCNEVYLVMWLAPSSSCSTLLYSVFMHTGLELYVCLTTCTSLSSSQQHLAICNLDRNTVIMCGSLFVLSRRNVFSKLNQFCHSVDTSLGLSHCVVHIRGGLLALWTPACSLQRLYVVYCLAWISRRLIWPVFSQTAFDTEDPTIGWVELTGQRSSEVKLAKGEVRRKRRIEYREGRWRWRKVKTSLKRSPKLIFVVVPCALTWG